MNRNRNKNRFILSTIVGGGRYIVEVVLRGILLEIFFPNACALCGKTISGEGGACGPCQEKISVLPWLFCARCGRRITRENPCQAHKYRTPIAGMGAVANYDDGKIRQLIWAYKYRGRRELSRTFSELMVRYSGGGLLDILKTERALVIPIPLHEKRERARGFNQAALIAKLFSERAGLDYSDGVIKRIADRRPQVSIKEKTKRRENISGAFAVINAEPVRGRAVLLVDDVATTGATLEEAAIVVKRAGAKTIWALVIAR